ncbi:MAG TPA: hypothetical protein VJT16_01925 [Streptosporangiaceae bacterium]|jgi:hypothetical protein|nr:hypothetical protein [Streptosporangiaceae bacterium]
MTDMEPSTAISKAMIVGFALVATAGVIGMCGVAIAGTAIVRGMRRWMLAQEEPPSAAVKRKLAQAKAATAAGASAWQDGMATSGRH